MSDTLRYRGNVIESRTGFKSTRKNKNGDLECIEKYSWRKIGIVQQEYGKVSTFLPSASWRFTADDLKFIANAMED